MKKNISVDANISGYLILELMISLALFILILFSLLTIVEQSSQTKTKLNRISNSHLQMFRSLRMMEYDLNRARSMQCLNSNALIYDLIYQEKVNLLNHFTDPLILYDAFEHRWISKADANPSETYAFDSVIVNYIENKPVAYKEINNSHHIYLWTNCQIGKLFIPYEYDIASDKDYQYSQSSNTPLSNQVLFYKFVGVHYFVKENSENVLTLYKRKLSENNKIITTPILQNMVSFDIYAINDDNALLELNNIQQAPNIKALYISIASNLYGQIIQLDRLISLHDNIDFNVIK